MSGGAPPRIGRRARNSLKMAASPVMRFETRTTRCDSTAATLPNVRSTHGAIVDGTRRRPSLSVTS
ncbi:MAG: hypothetical protein F4Y96_00825 [Chloroflexi bacterium]|nr:hypothetical protein [Chloroflexota bacterium]